MKMLALLAAGLVAATALPVAQAAAQPTTTRVVTTTTSARPMHRTTVSTRTERTSNWHRAGWRHHSRWRTVCRTSWRHHHRVRTCRRARWG